MKAIIDGKRYNTDNAIKLGEVSYGYAGDFGHYIEALYKTPRSGAYFLAGEGGARSHYAVSDRPGEWRGGHKITPLSQADAMAWAERNLTADEVEQHFGGMVQDA